MASIPEIALQTKNAPIVFFDLDVTLTNADTDLLWYKWRVPRSPIEWPNYFYLKKLYRLYKKGELTEAQLAEFHKRRVGRMTVAKFAAACEAFFEKLGKASIYAGAYELVAAHRSNGSRLALITAQHEMIAAPFVRELKLDDLIGSVVAPRNEHFGDPVLPLCFREGKIKYADEYCRRHGTSLKDSAFYSDSINDVPLMQKVKYPVATNPEPALEKIAVERGWHVLRLS